MKNIAVLISGRGSNLLALARAVEGTYIRDARIALVISNAPDVRGLEMARELGLETITLDHRGRKREEHDRAMAAELRAREVELICLAGYMRLLSLPFTREFAGRILNVHPSLLPAFPGLDAQQQALDYGVKVTGCTVHLVDEQLDHGPIIKQAAVPVLPGEHDIAAGIFALIGQDRLDTSAVDAKVGNRRRFIDDAAAGANHARQLRGIPIRSEVRVARMEIRADDRLVQRGFFGARLRAVEDVDVDPVLA